MYSKDHTLYTERELRKFFFRHEIIIHNPVSIDELNQKVLDDIDNETEYIFAVGGDGTMNTISQNLIGKKTKLMILPNGTANDFAQELGITTNLKKISAIFNSQTTKLIDAIKVNEKYMMTNGGIGVACGVAETVDHLRKDSFLFKKMMKIMGKETYSFVFAQKMLTHPFEVRTIFIESNDYPQLNRLIKTPMILINNQEYIGGKFLVAPKTKNNDGKFNVTIFLHQSRFSFLKSTLSMMRGHYPHHDKDLISFETDKLTMTSADGKTLRFFGDGEIFPESMIFNVSVVPRSLDVFSYKGESLLCSGHSLDKIELIQ
jgi:diacylglycerol kinase family enzyme